MNKKRPGSRRADRRVARLGAAAGLYRAMMDCIRFYQFRDRERQVRYGLTVAQCHVLDCLVHLGPLTSKELAAHLYLDKSTVSRIVDGMEAKRLLVRVKEFSDRRSARLHQSAVGARRYKKLEQDVIREYRRAFARYTAADWTRSIGLLRELAAMAMTR